MYTESLVLYGIADVLVFYTISTIIMRYVAVPERDSLGACSGEQGETD